MADFYEGLFLNTNGTFGNPLVASPEGFENSKRVQKFSGYLGNFECPVCFFMSFFYFGEKRRIIKLCSGEKDFASSRFAEKVN